MNRSLDIERRARIHHLSLGGSNSRRVAKTLRRCSGSKRCGLAVCPICRDAWREKFAQQLESHLADEPAITWATIIFTQSDLRKRALLATNPRNVLQRFRMMLKRSGLDDLAAIGILEADYHEASRLWEPHVHVLIIGPKPDFSSLARSLKAHDTYSGVAPHGVYRPIHSTQLTTPAAVAGCIDYFTKFHPCRKWLYFKNEKPKSIKSLLRGTRLRVAYRWLARPPRDFVFLLNLRLDAQGFRAISALSRTHEF